MLLIGLSIVAILIVYGKDLEILTNEALNNDYYNYILLFPVFLAIIFYLKKDIVKATLSHNSPAKGNTKVIGTLSGLSLCLAAFILYWYGSFTFYPLEYHIISLPLFVTGLILFLSNYQTLKTLIFPIVFLLFLIPPPTTLLYTAAGALSSFNTQISFMLLKSLGLPVALLTTYASPTILLTNAGGIPVIFTVDIACSGIYSLIAYAMFAAFLAFVTITTVTKKILMFAFGFILFALLNPLRITTVVVAGFIAGEQTALIVHSFSGIALIFVGMILTLVIFEKTLKVRISTKPTPQLPCSKCQTRTSRRAAFCINCGRFLNTKTFSISKATMAKLLLFLLGSSIAVLSIQAPTFVTAQNTFELTTSNNDQNATTSVFPKIPGYSLKFLYQDTAYQKIAEQDASLMYAYLPTDGSKSIIYLDVGIASTLSNLHNWEVCLISLQTAQGQYPLVTTLDSREIQLTQNPPLTAQYIVFKNPAPENQTQVTLYWFEKAAFKTGLIVEQKYVRISLIILTQNVSNYKQLEQELFTVTQPIIQEWAPLENQALISLGVTAQQALFAVIVAFIVFMAFSQKLTQERKKSNNIKLFNSFSSKKEKILLQIIQETAKQNKNITTSDILQSLEKHVGKPVNRHYALSILGTLEKNGLVKRTVISINNSPRLVWQV